jgi:hypothetical protein
MGEDSGRNNAVYKAALKIGNLIAGAGLDEVFPAWRYRISAGQRGKSAHAVRAVGRYRWWLSHGVTWALVRRVPPGGIPCCGHD